MILSKLNWRITNPAGNQKTGVRNNWVRSVELVGIIDSSKQDLLEQAAHGAPSKLLASPMTVNVV